jgi:quercetin dioxygenase-like cupin family protein
MHIVQASDVPHIERPDGSSVTYYMFKDYEVMHSVIPPHSIQPWHHHDIISETIYVVEGELVVLWRENDQEKRQVLSPGDLIESERTIHTYANESDQPAITICLKHIPRDGDYHETFKNDKVLD